MFGITKNLSFRKDYYYCSSFQTPVQFPRRDGEVCILARSTPLCHVVRMTQLGPYNDQARLDFELIHP